MKIRIASDIHNEFFRRDGGSNFTFKPCPDDKDTILILAGDVDVGSNVAKFIKAIVDQFLHVIYVAGNHDYWGCIMDEFWFEMRELQRELPNFTFLEKDFLFYGDCLFLGGTLWTNYDNDPVKMAIAMMSMNDFDRIRIYDKEDGVDRRLLAEDLMNQCNETVEEFRQIVKHMHHGEKLVVITHHLPTYRSIHEAYQGNRSNCAYASSLEGLIADIEPDIWIHGHTHVRRDYDFMGTRIICNPYGYQGEKTVVDFDPSLVIDV